MNVLKTFFGRRDVLTMSLGRFLGDLCCLGILDIHICRNGIGIKM